MAPKDSAQWALLLILAPQLILSLITTAPPSVEIKKDLNLVPKSPPKNILIFLGMVIYSHRLSMWPLVQKLADEGHNITVFSSVDPKKAQIDPRIHEVVSETLAEFSKNVLNSQILNSRLKGFTNAQQLWNNFPKISITLYEKLSRDPKFLEWVENSKFDLVITDSGCDYGIALGAKFKAPTIIFSTCSPYPWQTDAFGAPVESWIPDMQFAYQEDMNFFQRVRNTLKPIEWSIMRSWSYFPKMDEIHKKMGWNLPPMEQLEKNVSLVLINAHFSEEYARSLPSKVVPIGGSHCSQFLDEGLHIELNKFMDESGPEGFILISFGSAAQISNLPQHLKDIFLNVMRKIPTKFILKWDGEPPEDLPKNVFLAQWLPQQNIFAHKNIKAVIYHGGLLGTQEAVCAGVPIIFMPIFGEQDFNSNRHVVRGTGIKLEWENLQQFQLEEAITKILTDPSYKENMKQMSKLFLDRPHTALETATWWVNYILRNGHVESLQPLGVHQTWYQRRGLDVWLFIGSFFLLAGIILFKILLILITILFKKSPRGDQTNVKGDKKDK